MTRENWGDNLLLKRSVPGTSYVGGYVGDKEKDRIEFERFFIINTGLLFDGGKSFILEADLKLEMNAAENCSSQKTDIFVEEIKSIFNDEETSDVLIIERGKEFKCHKNILMNKIVIKGTTAKAVEDI